ncbi:hypothetical protein GSI_15029 [Ganoderma sinense ZZ0214-1]|uniref:Uncharacterized protein n=1 Tax=Ganoderma sinense ZZ0214-1 TaxID=1077348 RepID=A0A2G8RLE4_9APHY|nr:hypothetical protein GSI_15029 [Ganoderma sinense ZZ0214-1]
MEQNGDSEVHRVWSLLSEVSEQLSQNRSSAVNLHALADGAKTQVIHSQTGFVLRRFNLDKPKEAYDAELERMNAAMSAENQALLNDNRQLSALIREYEQTLENVMTTFRTRAHEVQQRELTLMRQYESVLVQRESEALDEALNVNNARSESLARVGRLLRAVLRRLGGEDIQVYEAHLTHLHATTGGQSAGNPREPSKLVSHPEHAAEREGDEGESGGEVGKAKGADGGAHESDEQSPDQDQEENLDVNRLLEEDEDPEKRLAAAEWALERECELARLERENEELRALVNGLLKPPAAPTATTSTAAPQRPPESTSTTAPIPIPEHPIGEDEEDRSSDEHSSFSTFPRPQQRLLGGPPGTVGPFGTYKKNTLIRVDSR